MDYQNKRGGRIVLTDIEAPEKQEWNSVCEAMNNALELEKKVNDVSYFELEIFFKLAISQQFYIHLQFQLNI